MATIFVTGGAGYIGSHTVKKLVELGYDVLVYDNLSKGHKKSINKKASFIKGDLSDENKLNSVFKKHKVDAVMYFAGFIEAGESMIKPEKYFVNNVTNGINLLNAMTKNNIKRIIYSSSAGVYGNPKRVPIKVFTGGPRAWAAFLSGYLDTDGYVLKQAIAWGSVNHGLLSDCQYLLALMGANSSLNAVQQLKGNVGIFWRLEVRDDRSIGVLVKHLSPSHPKKAERLKEKDRTLFYWKNHKN